MTNKGKTYEMAARMENLLGRYLNSRNAPGSSVANGPHMDDDLLAAFTEGVLTEREAKPVVAHLVDCSFCRHVTAELVRLDLAFAEQESEVFVSETQPSTISEVLSGLFAKIFGTSDGAVFAHNEEKKADDDQAEESGKKKDPE